MRKLICVFLAIFLMAALSMSAFAAVMAEPCEACGQGTISHRQTIYGVWRDYSSTTCEHGSPFYHTDVTQRRTYTYVYKCDNCSFEEEIFMGYQYQICCGYTGKCELL